MHKYISDIIEHMAKSHEELANVIESERYVVAHLATLNYEDVPNHNPDFGPIESLMEHSMLITRNISSYLMSLAHLEDALAKNFGLVMQEMSSSPGEE